ncbi:hypothetical protein [Kaistella palustris]|uniref:hypothetical protein n=1 Tax=Kaistella palustris TaxID=493376 RepID=UPI000483916E|nr:hypothetical protein [Kaistella palustris]
MTNSNLNKQLIIKLLLIPAIKEFESEVKNILVKSGVKSFTYNVAKGFKNDAQSNAVNNWFASSYAETDSLLFTVFVPEENTPLIIKKIE